MKKALVIIFICFLSALPAYPEKKAGLHELLKPETLIMDDAQYYVTEGESVFIYSRKDHKLIKKFGKAGEGPREFKPTLAGFALHVLPTRDHLLVNSVDKLSFFRKNGEFVKEIKAPATGVPGFYKPLGRRFVGMAVKPGSNQSMAITINLFNEKLEKGKEISSQNFLQHGSMVFPVASPLFETNNNLIFAGGDEDFLVRIFDADGQLQRSIHRDYKKVAVSEEYKSGVFEAFKKNPLTKGMADSLKKIIKFKDYFPAIQLFSLDDDKVYITTYRKRKENYELFIYTVNGKFVKQVYVPLKYNDALQPYPYAIKKGFLYQLIENEDDEVWELHAVEIK